MRPTLLSVVALLFGMGGCKAEEIEALLENVEGNKGPLHMWGPGEELGAGNILQPGSSRIWTGSGYEVGDVLTFRVGSDGEEIGKGDCDLKFYEEGRVWNVLFTWEDDLGGVCDVIKPE